MNIIINAIFGIAVFIVGILVNAIWLHSQNKSYAQMIRNHVNSLDREPFIDFLTIVMFLILISAPYIGIISAIAVNCLIFLEGLRE